MLTIKVKDGESIEYGYYQGLPAVCEALQKELGADYSKLDVTIVDEQNQTV